MGMKGGAEKSWFPCKWAYDDMILLAFDCCNNNNFFCLWYDLEPHLEGGGGSGTAEDSNEMALPKLDGFFGNVAAVIGRWCDLVSHTGGTYCLFIFP